MWYIHYYIHVYIHVITTQMCHMWYAHTHIYLAPEVEGTRIIVHVLHHIDGAFSHFHTIIIVTPKIIHPHSIPFFIASECPDANASGINSQTLTLIITPPTNTSVYCRSTSCHAVSISENMNRATTAPSGSVKPDKVANFVASHNDPVAA